MVQTATATHPVDQMLPLPRLTALGVQHVLVMYAGCIAVPLIIAGALHLPKDQTAFLINADLFACGIATLLQCVGVWIFGIRLPVMMGVTFASVAPMIAIGTSYFTPGMSPDAHLTAAHLGLNEIYGSVIAAGAIGVLIAPIVGKMLRFFPPVVTGTVITTIGISIMGVGIDWAAGGVPAKFDGTYGDLAYIGIAAIVLIFILLVTKYCKGFITNIAVLLGLLFGFALALALDSHFAPHLADGSVKHLVDFAGVANAPWFGLVVPFSLGKTFIGYPHFDAWSIAAMTAVLLVTFVESAGMFLAVGDTVGRPVDEKALIRGLRVDGLGTLIGGTFNTFPHTSFSQNVGLVAVTGVRSRWVCALGGLILVILGLFPKVAQVVASIPLFVLGGAGVVMFGMVLATGIRILSRADLRNNRSNLYIIAISLGLGMIPVVSGTFFNKLPHALVPFLHSGILLAAVSAVLLNVFFNGTGDPAEKSAQTQEH